MSATLSNITDLKMFLKAEVYSNDFRPVGVQFYLSPIPSLLVENGAIDPPP